MAQILFIHLRGDRAAADFILRAFADTNVAPKVLECSEETLVFAPGAQFEKAVQESNAVFVLLTAAVANNKYLKNQFVSVCNFAAGTMMKEVWVFEPSEQFAKITTTVGGFKHYARFESSDGWAFYLQQLIKYYDDSSVPVLLAATGGGGALLAEKDKLAGAFFGLLTGLCLLALRNSNQAEFGKAIVCSRCRREFRLHLTDGEKEFRCLACGMFYLVQNSPAFNLLRRRKQLSGGNELNSAAPRKNLIMNDKIKTPTAFISYSWDGTEHKNWVRELAARLREEGIEVTLDQWHLVPGDPLPEFMERAVSENDFVLLVCTPNFKAKADQRRGGVGYEGNIMTGELFLRSNHRKFIPLLRHEDWAEAAPAWLQAKNYIDLSDHCFEENFEELVKTLHGERAEPPPLGKRTSRKPQAVSAETSASLKTFTPADKAAARNEFPEPPIRITGIITEEVTKPRMDGTRGSGLYAVPFRLSSSPPGIWARLLVENWNNPPSFTMMHRPKIAMVSNDKVILDGTTIEEVEKYHRDTLLAVVARTNQQFDEYAARREQESEIKRQRENEHKQSVDDVSKRIKFG